MPTKKPTKAKKATKEELATAMGVLDFDKWLTEESSRTGKSKEKIIEETFRDGFLTWTIKDTESIVGRGNQPQSISQDTLDSMVDSIRKDKSIVSEKARDTAIEEIKRKFTVTESALAGGSIVQAPPILTAWAMPNVAEDIDELRRLRKDFAPVSRAVDYIKGMVLGNELDVSIVDPEDKSKKVIREDIKTWMKEVFQDQYTVSLYTLMSILLDEALTVGASGAEIRYKNSDFQFMDFVTKVEKSVNPVSKSNTGGKEFLYFETKEPEWKNLAGIVQLKIFQNGSRRLKLYRDPNTWEANYWTLDEIVAQGDTTMAISQSALKPSGGTALKFHPWQLFWLNVNRRQFDERGMSVIEPVKGVAVLLEKILNAVGEGCFRAGNKKYFIVCGTEKRPWSKPHIRNVMQQIQEMGKRNWTTVPVPYGFDIKEIGGNVFQANQVITILVNLLAQGMHVPTEILGILVRAVGTSTGERQVSMSFNEIEQMRYEFKQAIENQLFRKQLWCTEGKTKGKQGGKGSEPIYIPELKVSTKGLMSPFDKLSQIEKLLNVANPVSPQMKLELEREMASILGYDNIDFETQEELKKELKERTGTDTSIANPLTEKGQGQPEPQTRDRQVQRQAGGVNKGIKGGTRIPKEQKAIGETFVWDRELENHNFKIKRALLMAHGYTHDAIDSIFMKGILDSIKVEETSLTQEPSQKPQQITTSEENKTLSSSATGGNYGPQGYYKVMEIPESTNEGDTFEIDGPIVDSKITVEIRKLKDAMARYNKDLTVIYIDPSADPQDYKPYIAHEIQEYIFESNLGMPFDTAEKLAQEYEKIVCEELEMDWDAHEKRFKEGMEIINARKGVKNPEDIVNHNGSKKQRKPKPTEKIVGERKVKEIASEGQSSMRSESGDHQAATGVQSERAKNVGETKTVDVNITVKTEPLKIEQGKSEVVIIETSKPEVEKALTDLKDKQKEVTDKLASISKEIKEKMDMTNQELDIATKTKIEMEIANLEAERRKTESERIIIEETAKKKKELLEEIERKLKESD